MSDKAIGEQSKMFLLAGHETSSSALTWIIYLLASHPSIQNKLASEVFSSSSSSSEVFFSSFLSLCFHSNHSSFVKDTITMETLDKLQYLNKVIKEGMRVYPPAVTLMRKCENEDTVSTIIKTIFF